MPHLLLLLPLTAVLSAEPARPADCAAELRRRSVSEAALEARGLLLREELCYKRGPDGRTSGEPLSEEELAAALAARVSAGAGGQDSAAGAALVAAPPLLPMAEVTPAGLDKLFDGLASAAAQAARLAPADAANGLPQVPASRLAAPRADPWEEPAFDARWSAVERQLASPKTSGQALHALARRFRRDEDSVTGLAEDAPEALRLLADALHDGRGGAAALAELRRELAVVAGLKPRQKAAFAARLRSPRTVFIALSRARSAHSLEARYYFERMEALLATQGLPLPQFVSDEDPRGRYAAEFFLRCHAYDLLIPRLNRHPQEASALAPWLFPDDPSVQPARANQLEGLMTQLASQGRRSGALEAFFEGLEARAAVAPPAVARRIAAYAKVNEKLLPRSWRPRIAALAALLPAGLLESEGLAPDEPYDLWPSDRWTFSLHFASTDGYHAFLANFRARGWTPDGPGTLSKGFDGGLTIRLVAKLHPGDKEGFLRGAVAARYLADVRRDLRDPDVQGVILRNHAQFRIVGLFDKKVTPGKLLLDGSCRSAWDLRTLRRSCPTCQFIVNTGTGRGHVNNEAVAAIVEGLGRREDWGEIGDAWARLEPNASSRLQGPWTPPYEQALRVLGAAERAAAAQPAAK